MIAEAELPTRRLALLAYAFEESDPPIKRVDAIDWHSASPAFRQRIAERHAIIQRTERTR